jgi:hypothetical protein
MKRDPRSEVMEQLVPNLVGGTKMGLALRNAPEATPAAVKKPGATRTKIVSGVTHQHVRKKRLNRQSLRFGARDYRNQR